MEISDPGAGPNADVCRSLPIPHKPLNPPFIRFAYVVLATVLLPFALACGGGGDSKPAGGSTSTKVKEGNTRFLMTGAKGLVEKTGSKEKVVIHFDDGSFVLDPAISADGKKLAFAVQHPATADKNGKVD